MIAPRARRPATLTTDRVPRPMESPRAQSSPLHVPRSPLPCRVVLLAPLVVPLESVPRSPSSWDRVWTLTGYARCWRRMTERVARFIEERVPLGEAMWYRRAIGGAVITLRGVQQPSSCSMTRSGQLGDRVPARPIAIELSGRTDIWSSISKPYSAIQM